MKVYLVSNYRFIRNQQCDVSAFRRLMRYLAEVIKVWTQQEGGNGNILGNTL